MSADHVHYQRKVGFPVPKLSGKLAGGRSGLKADMHSHARGHIIFYGVMQADYFAGHFSETFCSSLLINCDRRPFFQSSNSL
jgi:hypothetical protein